MHHVRQGYFCFFYLFPGSKPPFPRESFLFIHSEVNLAGELHFLHLWNQRTHQIFFIIFYLSFLYRFMMSRKSGTFVGVLGPLVLSLAFFGPYNYV